MRGGREISLLYMFLLFRVHRHKESPMTIKFVSMEKAFIDWQLKIQDEVISEITGYLVSKAVTCRTTDLVEISSFIENKYKQTFIRYSNVCKKKDIEEWMHDCVARITDWEFKYSRPHLSALVVRTGGSDVGLPHLYFWEKLGLKSTRSEKKTQVKIIHSAVFDYYSVLRYIE